jgi:type VI secretion system protein ImpL
MAADHVLQSITGSFDLASVSVDRPAAEPESRSYFLRSLFADVIIRDRNRVAPTSKMASTRELVRRAAVAAVALLVAGFAWWAGSAFAGSAADIRSAAGAVESSASTATLERLDSLRAVIVRLEETEGATTRFLRLGLDRSPSLVHALRARYLERARPIFDDLVFQPLETRMNERVERNAPRDAERRADEKDDLRAYLLLGTELGRLWATEDSTLERPFLKSYLRRAPGLRAADSAYTDLFVDVLREPVMPTDSALVARVRARLYVLPTLDRLYDEMMHGEAVRQLSPFTLGGVLGGGATPFDNPEARVAGVFTRSGWESYVQGAIEQWSREPGKTDWVLGSRPERLPVELRDPERVAGMLLQKYFEDYVAAWRDFLGDVRYRKFDLRTGPGVLSTLGDPERSPFIALVDSVSTQTRFENAVVSASKEKVRPFIDRVLKAVGLQRAPGAAGGESANPVDRTFASFHALRAEGGAPLREIVAQYQTFGQMMQTLAGSGEAVSQLAVEKGRARGAIARAAGRLDPEIRDALFERPLDIALGAVRRGTMEEVGDGWRRKVCQPFNAELGALYPFDPNGKDAAIKDVESFFRPRTGTLAEFRDGELPAIVKPGTLQPIDPQGGGLSPAAASALRIGSSIGELFFDRDELRVEFDVTPELAQVDVLAPGLRAFAGQFCLRIDGEQYCSRMGYRETRTFAWPGTGQGGAQISATVHGANNRALPLRPLESPGPWGWLRLLDRAEITTERGETYATWELEEPGRYKVRVKYKLMPKGGKNPFDSINRRLFARFACPANL